MVKVAGGHVNGHLRFLSKPSLSIDYDSRDVAPPRAVLMGGMSEQASDEDLYRAYRDRRDEQSLRRLVGRHWSSSFRLALAVTGDPASAEDVAQEAFVRVVEAARRRKSLNPFGGWLRTVVLNRAKNERRSALRRARKEARARVSVSTPGGEEETVRELVADLPEDLRDALVLHFGLGYTHAEVAEATGCPQGTAASRIRLGVDKLRVKLREKVRTAPARVAEKAVETAIASALGYLVRTVVPGEPDPARLDDAARARAAKGSSLKAVGAALAVTAALAVASAVALKDPGTAPPRSGSSPGSGAIATASSASDHGRARKGALEEGDSSGGFAPADATTAPATFGKEGGSRAAVAPAPRSVGDHAIVRGVVRDRTGRPVREAAVRVLRMDPPPRTAAETKTDDAGRYELDLPRGTADDAFFVRAFAPGLIAGHSVGVAALRSDVTEVDPLILVPVGTLRGMVHDVAGHPLAASIEVVTVMPSSDAIPPAHAGTDGRFTIAEIPEGLHDVRVDSGGFPRAQVRISIVGGAGGDLDIALASAGRITGTVRLDSGEPVASARVAFFRDGHVLRTGRSCTTETNGHFEVGGIEAGPLVIVIRSGDLVFTAPLDVRTGSDTLADAVLRRGSTLEGRLSSARGEPLTGLKVRASEETAGSDADWTLGRETTTDDSGRYVLAGLVEGSYRIAVEPAEGGLELTVRDGVPVASASTLDLVLPATGTVSGRVVGTDGRPASTGVHVTIVPANGVAGRNRQSLATVHEDGNFELGPIPEGDYFIGASRQGGDGRRSSSCFESVRQAIHVTAGEQLSHIELGLRAGHGVKGRVLDSLGSPVSGILVSLRSDLTAARRTERTDELGRFAIPWLDRGEWRVEIGDAGLAHAARRLGVGRVKVTGPTELEVGDADVEVDLTIGPE
jgi:RNA polymerase sigma-70 factor (ECF subfamily)